jgi:hypothetical protein
MREGDRSLVSSPRVFVDRRARSGRSCGRAGPGHVHRRGNWEHEGEAESDQSSPRRGRAPAPWRSGSQAQWLPGARRPASLPPDRPPLILGICTLPCPWSMPNLRRPHPARPLPRLPSGARSMPGQSPLSAPRRWRNLSLLLPRPRFATAPWVTVRQPCSLQPPRMNPCPAPTLPRVLPLGSDPQKSSRNGALHGSASTIRSLALNVDLRDISA